MRKGSALATAVATMVTLMALGLATPALAGAANIPRDSLAAYEYGNYVAVPATVSATTVLPKLKCTTGPQRFIDAGVGMESVESFAGLFIGCNKGKAHYYPSLEVQRNTKNYPSDTAHPGDRIEFKMTQSTTRVTDTVIDETHHFTATKNGAGSGTGLGPTIGDFAVYIANTKLGVPNFGTLAFTNALANGATSTPGPFGSLGPTGYNMVAGPGTAGPLQIKTDPFASKESFKTVFTHS